jgi:hypothetical protein
MNGATNPWLLWGCVMLAIADAKGIDLCELIRESKDERP